MRCLLCIAICIPAAFAQAPDAADIVQRSALAARANGPKAAAFAYREHQVNIQVDKDGKEKSRRSQTWDVIGLEGSTYRKLILRDEKPLPPKDQKREEERLSKETAKRRKENAQRGNRTLSLSYNLSVGPKDMHLYDLTYLGEDVIEGRPAYMIQAVPKAGVRPASSNEKELQHYKLKRWIDTADLIDARIEMEILSPGSRMQPGTLIDIKMLRTPDGVWLQQDTRWHYNAKFFKLAGARGDQTSTRSDFHRFEVTSRIVDDAP